MAANIKARQIRAVLGLGNPGLKYQATRHNLGYAVVYALASHLGIKKFDSRKLISVAKANIRGTPVLLAVNLTYMNESGRSAQALLALNNITPEELLIVHDDLDLEQADVRLKKGGGSGGHNGLKSIIQDVGSHDFYRVRMGIGRPPFDMDPADFVLRPMRKGERQEFEPSIETAVQIIEQSVDNIDLALSTYRNA